MNNKITRIFRLVALYPGVFLIASLIISCAHYPVNSVLEQYSPDSGCRGKYMNIPANSEDITLLLAFSGGGTRADSFSYGLLEELRDTEVTIKGKKYRLLDEVEVISGVL